MTLRGSMMRPASIASSISTHSLSRPPARPERPRQRSHTEEESGIIEISRISSWRERGWRPTYKKRAASPSRSHASPVTSSRSPKHFRATGTESIPPELNATLTDLLGWLEENGGKTPEPAALPDTGTGTGEGVAFPEYPPFEWPQYPTPPAPFWPGYPVFIFPNLPVFMWPEYPPHPGIEIRPPAEGLPIHAPELANIESVLGDILAEIREGGTPGAFSALNSIDLISLFENQIIKPEHIVDLVLVAIQNNNPLRTALKQELASP